LPREAAAVHVFLHCNQTPSLPRAGGEEGQATNRATRVISLQSWNDTVIPREI